MKILRIIASANPESGGVIEGLVRSAMAMHRLGHKTEVVTLDSPGAPWLSSLPFNVHPVGPATRPYGYSPRLVPWLRAHRENYDVAVVEGIWNYASFGAWRALTGGSVPYVLYLHGMLDPWFRQAYPLKHWAKQAYWLLAEGRVLRDAARVLFTTEEELRLAKDAFWGFRYHKQVVGFGTADVPADIGAQAKAWRKKIPALHDRRFLLYLSRIHPKKACDLLIEAFSDVAGAYPDLDLVMAGPDQVGWRPNLESQARALGVADRIHWPGMLAGDAKWGAFRAADAFVLPSHQENFGIVVAEAMACNMAVLITDKVNIWREVQETGGGIIGDDSRAGIAHMLRKWLALPKERRAHMRNLARKGFLEHFEVQRAATRLADVLEQIRSLSPDTGGGSSARFV